MFFANKADCLIEDGFCIPHSEHQPVFPILLLLPHIPLPGPMVILNPLAPYPNPAKRRLSSPLSCEQKCTQLGLPTYMFVLCGSLTPTPCSICYSQVRSQGPQS